MYTWQSTGPGLWMDRSGTVALQQLVRWPGPLPGSEDEDRNHAGSGLTEIHSLGVGGQKESLGHDVSGLNGN